LQRTDLQKPLPSATLEIMMKKFTYRVSREAAFKMYKENGMAITFDESLFNGLLVIEAPDEETADKIRMTFTDIRMWEKAENE
jgi:hypothetical protein